MTQYEHETFEYRVKQEQMNNQFDQSIKIHESIQLDQNNLLFHKEEILRLLALQESYVGDFRQQIEQNLFSFYSNNMIDAHDDDNLPATAKDIYIAVLEILKDTAQHKSNQRLKPVIKEIDALIASKIDDHEAAIKEYELSIQSNNKRLSIIKTDLETLVAELEAIRQALLSLIIPLLKAYLFCFLKYFCSFRWFKLWQFCQAHFKRIGKPLDQVKKHQETILCVF